MPTQETPAVHSRLLKLAVQKDRQSCLLQSLLVSHPAFLYFEASPTWNAIGIAIAIVI